jgi:DNA-binding response OmpR family regulator
MIKVLLIDDDEQNREIIKLRLEQAGFKVEEAANGEEGLALAREAQPNLIVLDVMMPKMDGWQACRGLKSNEKTKDIPVIMLTARTQQIEELRGWESGVDDYMTKPCDHKVLIQKINQLAGSR